MKLGRFVFALMVTAAAATSLPALALPTDPPAKAEKDDTARTVFEAERLLEAGKLAQTVKLLLKKFPSLESLLIVEGREPTALETRAVRIVALASIRSDGAVGVAAPSSKKAEQNVEWSVFMLRRMSADRKGDAHLRADLGEALEKQPATQEEALALLSALAREDLIPTAHAYAALARLQAKAGEPSKSAESFARCERLAVTPSICRARPR